MIRRFNINFTVIISLAVQMGISLFGQTSVGGTLTAPQRADGMHSVDIVPPDTKVIEEKTLFFDASAGGPNDAGGDRANGNRAYVFQLKPGERLFLRLKTQDPNKISMNFPSPLYPGIMAAQYRRIANMPVPLRSSKVDITNITKQPLDVLLLLSGQVNYSYRLEIERKL